VAMAVNLAPRGALHACAYAGGISGTGAGNEILTGSLASECLAPPPPQTRRRPSSLTGGPEGKPHHHQSRTIAESLLDESDATERLSVGRRRRRSSGGGGGQGSVVGTSRRSSLVAVNSSGGGGAAHHANHPASSEEDRRNFESLQKAIKSLYVTTNAGIRELFARHIDEGDYADVAAAMLGMDLDGGRCVELEDMSASSRSSSRRGSLAAADGAGDSSPSTPPGADERQPLEVAKFKRAVRRLSMASSQASTPPDSPVLQEGRGIRRGSMKLLAETFRLDGEVLQA